MSIACHCAKELDEEGMNIVLSHANAGELLEHMRAELEGPVTTVHLGAPEEVEGFDHAIDTVNRSASDVYKQLEKIIASAK